MQVWICFAVCSVTLLQASAQAPVHCQWGPYGDWSECDGCTKTQVRTRPILVYAQFGGIPCMGDAVQKQNCVTKRGCPLQDGCGDRFRCHSGQCISPTLKCNGDQDCEEDGSDEQNCVSGASTVVCDSQQIPPQAEMTGKGFDILTGKQRNPVINTKSFGGQCRKVYSGDTRVTYRLPQSLVGYTFQVSVQNDFQSDFYESSWKYVKDTEYVKKSNRGHHIETFHHHLYKSKSSSLVIIKNHVEVAQFQASSPAYLTLSESFWKALVALPVVYDYGAYRTLIEGYGTHYPTEGSLGGSYKALLYADRDWMQTTTTSLTDFQECVKTTHRILFIKWTTETCSKTFRNPRYDDGYDRNETVSSNPIIGGEPAYIAALSVLDLNNPTENWNKYTKWAGSVKYFPKVINQKLMPLYELVKEVPCAELKKLHLKRAIEQYMNEEDPCHCRPCRNNGLPVLQGRTCMCVCKPGTEGLACEIGKSPEDQPGVIHGEWACWSSWSSCSNKRRSRSRTCNNPSPAGGGKHCNGDSVESKACEDEDMAHLRIMEPHCFDSSLTPARSCKTPPPLVNGYVRDLKYLYAVGSLIEYACIEGYHLVGIGTAECKEDLTWSYNPKECKSTMCQPPLIPPNVRGSPWKVSYEIGDRVTLSCPTGMQLEGDGLITCDSSLNWAPGTKVKCNSVQKEETLTVQCKPWEKVVKEKCICKMPYECKSSLDMCATKVEGGLTRPLSVCRFHAMLCLGYEYSVAEHGACEWPTLKANSCPSCQLWEKCDEKTNQCVCREPEECVDPGSSICARAAGDGVAMTMTECRAGIRRCRGEEVAVVSAQPCQA